MRCALYSKTGCKARAVQVWDTLELRLSGTHCHGPEGSQDNVLEFLRALRRSVDVHSTLKDVYDEVALSYPQATLHRCFESVRPSMSRWRAKKRLSSMSNKVEQVEKL